MIKGISQAIMEITSECNLKCSHCYRQETKDLTTEQIFFIIDKLKRIGIKELSLLGGEPTLRNDFEEIIEYAVSNIKSVNVQTNGTIKTFLSQHKCTVDVSFEYPDKKNNDNIRKFKYGKKKDSVFEYAIRKIKTVTNDKVLRWTLYNDTPILKCLVMSEMYGCNSIFVPLIPTGCGKDLLNKVPDEEKIAEALYNIAEFNKIAIYHHEIQIPQNYLFDKNLYLKYGRTFKDRGRICGAGFSRIFICSNGDVKPCPFINYYCGNILKDSESFIKNKLHEFNVKMEKKKLSGNCGKCFFGSLCGGGCMAYSFSKTTRNQSNCPVNFLIKNYKEEIR